MLTDELREVVHKFFIKIRRRRKPRLRDTGSQYVTGCCTSAAGDKKRIPRKGCRWRKEGVACRTENGACVPSLGITVATLAVSNHRDPLAASRRIRYERPDSLSPPLPVSRSIASLFACEARVFPTTTKTKTTSPLFLSSSPRRDEERRRRGTKPLSSARLNGVILISRYRLN